MSQPSDNDFVNVDVSMKSGLEDRNNGTLIEKIKELKKLSQ